MTHRLAAMRCAVPIPALDVSKPALAPTAAAKVVTDLGKPDRDMTAIVHYTIEDGVFKVQAMQVKPAAPALAVGDWVMSAHVLTPDLWAPTAYTMADTVFRQWRFRRPTADELARFWPEDKP